MRKWQMTGVVAALGLSMVLAGCTQADAVKAASTIHAYLPTVMALADDAAALAGEIDAADAAKVRAVSGQVQSELAELETVSGAYAASPTADGWERLGAVVDALVSDADQGLMAALAIKDASSQAKVKVAMSALDAAAHVVDGYLLSARTPAEAQAAASTREVKLQSVVRYWSSEDWKRVELALGESREKLMAEGMQSGL